MKSPSILLLTKGEGHNGVDDYSHAEAIPLFVKEGAGEIFCTS
jgi:hypothetical protein